MFRSKSPGVVCDNAAQKIVFGWKRYFWRESVAYCDTAMAPGVSVSFKVLSKSSEIVVGLVSLPFSGSSVPGGCAISCGLHSGSGQLKIFSNHEVDSDLVMMRGFSIGDEIGLSISASTSAIRTPALMLHISKNGSPACSVNITSMYYSVYPLFPAVGAYGKAAVSVRVIDGGLTRAGALDFERRKRPFGWSTYVETGSVTFGIDGLHRDVTVDDEAKTIEFAPCFASEERSVTCNRALVPGVGISFVVSAKHRDAVVFIGVANRPYPCGRLPGFQQYSAAVRSDTGRLVMHTRPPYESAPPGEVLAPNEHSEMSFMAGGFRAGEEIRVFLMRGANPISPIVLQVYKGRSRLPPVDISQLCLQDAPLFPIVGCTRGCKITFQPIHSSIQKRLLREQTAALKSLTWFDHKPFSTHKFIAIPDDIEVLDASRTVLFHPPQNQSLTRCIFSQRAMVRSMRVRFKVDMLPLDSLCVIGATTLPYPSYSCPGQHRFSIGLVSTNGVSLMGTGEAKDRYGVGRPCISGFRAGDEIILTLDLSTKVAWLCVEKWTAGSLAETARVDITCIFPGVMPLFPAIACSGMARFRFAITEQGRQDEPFAPYTPDPNELRPPPLVLTVAPGGSVSTAPAEAPPPPDHGALVLPRGDPLTFRMVASGSVGQPTPPPPSRLVSTASLPEVPALVPGNNAATTRTHHHQPAPSESTARPSEPVSPPLPGQPDSAAPGGTDSSTAVARAEAAIEALVSLSPPSPPIRSSPEATDDDDHDHYDDGSHDDQENDRYSDHDDDIDNQDRQSTDAVSPFQGVIAELDT
jgi:hypothetical protein